MSSFLTGEEGNKAQAVADIEPGETELNGSMPAWPLLQGIGGFVPLLWPGSEFEVDVRISWAISRPQLLLRH